MTCVLLHQPLKRMQLSEAERATVRRRSETHTADRAHADERDLVLRSCTFLLVGSIALNRSLFGRSFVRQVEECWPFTLAATSCLQQTARRRFRRVGRDLVRRKGASSLLELL